MSPPRRTRVFAAGPLAWLLSAAVFVVPARGSAQPVFTGPEVTAAQESSVDIVDTHLYFLAAQARAGRPLGFMGGTARWAPGRILMASGERVAANLSRTQLYVGDGFGSTQGGGVFAGAFFDFVQITNPFYADLPNFTESEGGEGEAYLGAAWRDVQVTLSLAASGLGGTPPNRDAHGDFLAQDQEELPRRAGFPYPEERTVRGLFWLLAAYDTRTGAYVAASVVERGDRNELSEVRAHLQPLAGLVPKEVRAVAGLPALGLRRLDPFVDHYAERDADSTAAPAPPPATSNEKWEVDLGADDVLSGGLRWRTRLQVRPSPLLRMVELGYVEEWGADGPVGVRVGARAAAVRRGASYAPSGEGYALLRLSNVRDGLHLGGSYGYDVPDGTTFLPLRRAHVFGVQLVLGSPEAARPVVPLVREIEERKQRKEAEP